MKLPRTSIEALRAILDDAEGMVLKTPDADMVAETRGCWLPGAMADQARRVVRDALRADRAPRLPRSAMLPVSRRLERHDRD